MILPKVREVKLHRPKVAAAVTSFRKDIDVDEQIDNIMTWKKGAEDALVVTNVKFTEREGMVRSFTKTESPPISDMLKRVEPKLGTDQAIMLLDPSCVIVKETDSIFGYVNSMKLQRSWAGYFMPEYGKPIGFVFAGTILKYLAQDLIDPTKEDLTMDDPEWAQWVYDWIQKSVPNQRKFDASGFGIVQKAKFTPVEFIESIEPPPLTVKPKPKPKKKK